MIEIMTAGMTIDIVNLEAISWENAPTPIGSRIVEIGKFDPASIVFNLPKAQSVIGKSDSDKRRDINPAVSKGAPHQSRKSFKVRTVKAVINKMIMKGIAGLQVMVVLNLRRFSIEAGTLC